MAGASRTDPTSASAARGLLPRDLHPAAWWLWALALATAASRTLNPLLLGLIVAVTAYVVVRRRGDAPWARGFKYFLAIALVAIGIRVTFRVLLGGGAGEILLFTLPQVVLPGELAGVTIGGPVMAESVVAAFYDGLRLATMLVCLGAANSLANPKRLLKALPGALYELGMAVVVALSVAPQLIESVLRVRRARRLRGGRRTGLRALGGILLPVLEDALDRSIRLAAAMDSRGYGRRGATTRQARRRTGALVITGLLGICGGMYGLLSGDPAARSTGLASFVVGSAVAVLGMVLGGRHVRRSRYRPDPWLAPEWVVAGSGAAAAVTLIAVGSVAPEQLYPSVFPLAWPTLALWPTFGIALAALPAWLAPPAARPRRLPPGDRAVPTAPGTAAGTEPVSAGSGPGRPNPVRPPAVRPGVPPGTGEREPVQVDS